MAERGKSRRTKTIVEIVLESVIRGDSILIGRNHLGRAKIKIVGGPFGLFTRRYETDDVTLDHIKRMLASI